MRNVIPKIVEPNSVSPDDTTPFLDYVARGGNPKDKELVALTVDDIDVIPNCFLEKPGKLLRLVRDINGLYLRRCTPAQRHAWWTTPNILLTGRAPIDFISVEPGIDQMLIGMARNYYPSSPSNRSAQPTGSTA